MVVAGGIKWDVSSGRVAETDSNNIALKSCNATRSPQGNSLVLHYRT